MSFLDPKTHAAPIYFKRAGRMFLIAAGVVAVVTVLVAPDNLGRGFGALFTAIIALRGALLLKKSRTVSPNAVVHESARGRYEIENRD